MKFHIEKIIENSVLPLFMLVPLIAFFLALFPPVITPTVYIAPVTQDMSGRAINVSLPANRALIFPVILSSYITIDGGTEHIMATTEPARNLAIIGLLGQIYPAVSQIPTLGTTVAPVDPEHVIALKPDAVFVWAEQAESLERVGLPGLIEVSINPKDQPGSRLAMWKLMGSVTSKQGKADSLLTRYFSKCQELKSIIPNTPADKPRVAILYRVGNGFWGIGGRNYNLNDRLEFAGAQNAAMNYKISGGVDLEQLLVLDPDIILLNSGPGDDLPQNIYTRPEWESLRAVRERRVYKMPVYSYMNAVINAPVEDPLLLLWMAELFYPDKMPRKLRSEFKETYRNIYQYDISDEEIDSAIFLKENLCSAGYERFSRPSLQK